MRFFFNSPTYQGNMVIEKDLHWQSKFNYKNNTASSDYLWSIVGYYFFNNI